jgi:hypothetical protein
MASHKNVADLGKNFKLTILKIFCQSLNSPGLDDNILRHSGIWEAADEAVLNDLHNEERKNAKQNPL